MKNLLTKILFISLLFSTITPAIQANGSGIAGRIEVAGGLLANNSKIIGISVVAAAGSGLVLRKAYKAYQAKKGVKEGIVKIDDKEIEEISNNPEKILAITFVCAALAGVCFLVCCLTLHDLYQRCKAKKETADKANRADKVSQEIVGETDSEEVANGCLP